MFLVIFNRGGFDEFGTIDEVLSCLQSLDVEDCAEVYGAARLFMFGWQCGGKVNYPTVQAELAN